MLTLVPFWSSLVHLLIAALALAIRRIIASTSKSHLQNEGMAPPVAEFLNELTSSVAWVVVSLECLVVGVMWSKPVLLAIIAARLLLLPPLLGPTHFNPCIVLQQYLLNKRRKSAVYNMILLLLAEFLAIPVASFIMLATWHLLAIYNLSADHTHILGAEPEFFLSVSSPIGFLIEFIMSFLTFLPGLLFADTNVYRITQVVFVTFLIFMFGPLTGAFVNPMVALAFLLMWHREILGPFSILTHLFVFWIGPLLGAALAVKVSRTYKKSKLHLN